MNNTFKTLAPNQKSSYQSSDYEHSSQLKKDQRSRILKFILDNHQGEVHPRYIGLPGKYWFFESHLIHECPEAHITGVEKNYSIFHSGKVMMPGTDFLDRSILVDARLKHELFRTSNSIFAHGNLLGFTDEQVIKDSGKMSGTYKKAFTNNTCIWYDLTCSFNKDSYLLLYNIKNIINKHFKTVVCLTLMYGRDMYFNGKGENSRVEIVQRALPDFEPLDVWTYKGFNNSKMINICGVMNSRGSC